MRFRPLSFGIILVFSMKHVGAIDQAKRLTSKTLFDRKNTLLQLDLVVRKMKCLVQQILWDFCVIYGRNYHSDYYKDTFGDGNLHLERKCLLFLSH